MSLNKKVIENLLTAFETNLILIIPICDQVSHDSFVSKPE